MKILTALFAALVFDFLFLTGLKINYIDYYDLSIYYNPFFADNQPLWYLIFLLPSLVAFFMPKNITVTVLLVTTLLSCTPFVAGKRIGEELYAKEATYTLGKRSTGVVTRLYSLRGTDYVLFPKTQTIKAIPSEKLRSAP